jgi:hypothetical protein
MPLTKTDISAECPVVTNKNCVSRRWNSTDLIDIGVVFFLGSGEQLFLITDFIKK